METVDARGEEMSARPHPFALHHLAKVSELCCRGSGGRAELLDTAGNTAAAAAAMRSGRSCTPSSSSAVAVAAAVGLEMYNTGKNRRLEGRKEQSRRRIIIKK